jgi:hypothetical protein
MTDVREAARAFYADQLRRNDAAQHALAARGLSVDLSRRLGLGYAPTGWTGLLDHLRRGGATADEVMAAGLAFRAKLGPVDVLCHRLVFPVRDERGQLVGFTGRAAPGSSDATPAVDGHVGAGGQEPGPARSRRRSTAARRGRCPGHHGGRSRPSGGHHRVRWVARRAGPRRHVADRPARRRARQSHQPRRPPGRRGVRRRRPAGRGRRVPTPAGRWRRSGGRHAAGGHRPRRPRCAGTWAAPGRTGAHRAARGPAS